MSHNVTELLNDLLVGTVTWIFYWELFLVNWDIIKLVFMLLYPMMFPFLFRGFYFILLCQCGFFDVYAASWIRLDSWSSNPKSTLNASPMIPISYTRVISYSAGSWHATTPLVRLFQS